MAPMGKGRGRVWPALELSWARALLLGSEWYLVLWARLSLRMALLLHEAS